MRYRRSNVSAACYFVTVNLQDRSQYLLVDHVEVLRVALRKVKQNQPFVIVAIVIMPNHLHTLWQLPENDADFSTRWNLIKGEFSRALKKTESISKSRAKKRRTWYLAASFLGTLDSG